MPKIGDHPTDETRAKMRRAAHVRQAIKRAKRNQSPLRKVVSIEPGAWWRQVIANLECGHFKTFLVPAPKRTRCDACWQPAVKTDKNAVRVIYGQMPGDSEETPEDRIKYERDTLLMLILEWDEYGPGAFDRAVEKLKRATFA